jgi:hypothetical protein
MQFEILIVYFALTLPVYQEELLGVNERLHAQSISVILPT